MQTAAYRTPTSRGRAVIAGVNVRAFANKVMYGCKVGQNPGIHRGCLRLNKPLGSSSSHASAYKGTGNYSSYNNQGTPTNQQTHLTSYQSQQSNGARNFSTDMVNAKSRGADLANVQKTVKVKFCLKFEVQYGQLIRVIGSHPSLGNWQLQSAPTMQWSPGHKWECLLEFPAGSVIEYKYVVTHHGSSDNQNWQSGSNAVLGLNMDEGYVEVRDNWYNGPGALIVIDGKKEMTREAKLAVWAKEMVQYEREAKEAKLDLYKATDENQALRNEVARLRMELSLASQGRAEADRRIAELEEESFLLRAQLTQAQIAMKSTLEEAISLLTADMGTDAVDGSQAVRSDPDRYSPLSSAPEDYGYSGDYRDGSSYADINDHQSQSEGGSFFDRLKSIVAPPQASMPKPTEANMAPSSTKAPSFSSSFSTASPQNLPYDSVSPPRRVFNTAENGYRERPNYESLMNGRPATAEQYRPTGSGFGASTDYLS